MDILLDFSYLAALLVLAALVHGLVLACAKLGARP
jgi:hypothetical protein